MTKEEAIIELSNLKTYKIKNKYALIGEERFEALDMAIKALEQQPKTGHWIADVDRWGDIVTTVNGYRCSECNTFDTDKDNYCPNCGAKMEVEE